MTRKFLQGLGIDTDIIDKIMDAHGEGIEREKGVAEKLGTEIKKLKGELETAQNDLVEPEGADDLGQKVKDLQQLLDDEIEAHKTTKGNYAAEKEGAVIDGLVADALKSTGMNEAVIPKALKLYDRAIVEQKDGALSNADKVIEHFKSEWADFFMEVRTDGTNPPTPPKGSGSVGKTVRELMIEANNNPAKMPEILAQIDAMNKPKKE